MTAYSNLDGLLRHSNDALCVILNESNFDLIHIQPIVVALLVGVRPSSNGRRLWTYERFVLLGLAHILQSLLVKLPYQRSYNTLHSSDRSFASLVAVTLPLQPSLFSELLVAIVLLT